MANVKSINLSMLTENLRLSDVGDELGGFSPDCRDQSETLGLQNRDALCRAAHSRALWLIKSVRFCCYQFVYPSRPTHHILMEVLFFFSPYLSP